MSSTTTTQYYGLTQYIGTDKPDFADNNTAFRNVDADLHQVVQDSQGFSSDIADLTQRVGDLDTDLTNLSGDLDGEKAKIIALQNKELSQDGEIERVERNAQDMITAYNEASATSTHAYSVGDYFIYNDVLYQATAAIAVGATIVPDTNCTTTNVTSELIQLNTSLTDVNTSLSEINVGKNSVYSPVSDETTYGSALNQLLTHIDTTKISVNSVLIVGIIHYHFVRQYGGGLIEFSATYGDSDGISTNILQISANSAAIKAHSSANGTTITNFTNDLVGTNYSFTLYY